jgi:hypothetical protein
MDVLALAYIASPTEMANGWQLYQYVGTAFIFALFIGALIFSLSAKCAWPNQRNLKVPS